MEEKALMTIDCIGESFLREIGEAGWEVRVEEDFIGDFKHFKAVSVDAPYGAFTRLDITLKTLDCNPMSVEIGFEFIADPRMVFRTAGRHWEAFSKMIEDDGYGAIKAACERVLEKARIAAGLKSIKVRTSGLSLIFDDMHGIPAFKAELVYRKEPG
jgi:hypothetical protein